MARDKTNRTKMGTSRPPHTEKSNCSTAVFTKYTMTRRTFKNFVADAAYKAIKVSRRLK